MTSDVDQWPAGAPPMGEEIAPLNAETSLQQLEQLTAAVQSLRRMRAARIEQHPETALGLSGDPSLPSGE